MLDIIRAIVYVRFISVTVKIADDYVVQIRLVKSCVILVAENARNNVF